MEQKSKVELKNKLQKMMHNIDGFPGGSNGKESAYNVGNPGSIPR